MVFGRQAVADRSAAEGYRLHEARARERFKRPIDSGEPDRVPVSSRTAMDLSCGQVAARGLNHA